MIANNADNYNMPVKGYSDSLLVATSDDSIIQNVLMDAFDRGIVNCQNFAKARAIINSRQNKRKRKNSKPGKYTVAALTSDIATTTQAKESYVREAQDKENRLFALLDGLATLWNDTNLLNMLEAEGLCKRPELAGTYSETVAQ